MQKNFFYMKWNALEIFSKSESLINIGKIPTKDLGRNHKNVEAVCNSNSLIFFFNV